MTVLTFVDPDYAFGWADPGVDEPTVDTVTSELRADGEVVYTGTEMFGEPIPVGPDPATYELTLDVVRDADWWLTSTETSTTWTFESEHEEEQELVDFLQVDYDVELDPYNHTDAPVEIRFRPFNLASGDEQTITDFTAQWSVDDGATWDDVTRAAGGRRLVDRRYRRLGLQRRVHPAGDAPRHRRGRERRDDRADDHAGVHGDVRRVHPDPDDHLAGADGDTDDDPAHRPDDARAHHDAARHRRRQRGHVRDLRRSRDPCGHGSAAARPSSPGRLIEVPAVVVTRRPALSSWPKLGSGSTVVAISCGATVLHACTDRRRGKPQASPRSSGDRATVS